MNTQLQQRLFNINHAKAIKVGWFIIVMAGLLLAMHFSAVN